MGDLLSILHTSDGSHSISSKNYQAAYHSIHGAIEESMHVFIAAGLYHQFVQGKKSIKILEMGFGTGLNAFLSLIAARKYGIDIEYHSIELHPLSPSIYNALNFHEQIPSSRQQDLISLHEAKWENLESIDALFKLKKIEGDLHQLQIDQDFDVIYYDAFAPSCQPDLWEAEIHQKLYNSLNQKGALVTYCAQGKFKRILKKIGYQLDKLPGPGRKHEMTRAVKA